MIYTNKYNTDDVFTRSILISTVSLLHRNIRFFNILKDQTLQEVKIPFYLPFYGSDRFIQDFFFDVDDCDTKTIHAEGNYDQIPRGVLQPTGTSVRTDEMTNHYVWGEYVRKDEKGNLVAYKAPMANLPLTISLDCSVEINTHLEAYKIHDEFFRTFYKSRPYNSSYMGIRIACQCGFDDSYNIEKNLEFSAGDDDKITVTSSLEVETYMPIIDYSQETFAGNRIEQFNMFFNEDEVKVLPPSDSIDGTESIDGRTIS